MAINPTQLNLEPAYHGDAREKLPVIGSSGTTPVSGNLILVQGTAWPNLAARELFLSNDSAGDITVTINCSGGTLAWVLHTGETFNERMPPFTSIIVTATGAWRWYVRGNLT